MKREDMLCKRFQINDTTDFDNFVKQAFRVSLYWMSGAGMESSTTALIRERPYPFVLEVNKQGFVVYDNHTYNSIPFKSTMDKEKKTEMPMTLLVNQKNPSITITLKDGREFVYNLEDALNDIDYFNDWLVSTARPPLKVGDIVRVVDDGQLYTTYFQWFKENNVDVDIAARYAYSKDCDYAPDTKFRIVAVGKHSSDASLKMYAISSIQDSFYLPVYLFNQKGIERYDD